MGSQQLDYERGSVLPPPRQDREKAHSVIWSFELVNKNLSDFRAAWNGSTLSRRLDVRQFYSCTDEEAFWWVCKFWCVK